MSGKIRITRWTIISRIRSFDEGISQYRFAEAGSQINGFIPLAKADASFGYRMGGVHRCWRWGFEFVANGKGNVIWSFNSGVWVWLREGDGDIAGKLASLRGGGGGGCGVVMVEKGRWARAVPYSWEYIKVCAIGGGK